MIGALVLASLFGASGVIAMAGCSDDSSGSGSRASTASSSLVGGITVSAASSLTGSFTRIGKDFMAVNPDVEVSFNFDSSSILATQILEGAPVDVFASADESNVTRLTDEDLIAGVPEVFARNELVIVTQPGNAPGISQLGDLADAGIVSLCNEQAPCGSYTELLLDEAGVGIPEDNVTRGQNVASTLAAVRDGDAVAGIVYRSDAERAGDAVTAVAIPTGQNVTAAYPIAVLADAEDVAVAEAFRDYVLSEDGQAVLEEFGFLPAT